MGQVSARPSRTAKTEPPSGSEKMRKEFESELAKDVSGRKKKLSKVWIAVAFCAAILVSGAAAVTAVAAGNGDCDKTQDQTQDQLQDGSCEDTDCDGEPDLIQDQDQLQDGSCEDCDGICDNLVP